jgi:hypothetical protein
MEMEKSFEVDGKSYLGIIGCLAPQKFGRT